MSYKNMSELAILSKYTAAEGEAKAELYETYDQIRDLTVSGPTIGGSGLGPASGFLVKLAQTVSGSSFLPIIGSQAVNIPGTSYYSPISGGTGSLPGGQTPFGLGPFSQTPNFPQVGPLPAGSAAGFDAASILASAGFGNNTAGMRGIGDPGYPLQQVGLGGTIAGGAAGIGDPGDPGLAAGAGAGLAAAGGFGRGFILPAAGFVSGVGGLLTTLAPMFGGSGLAGLAAGTVLSGVSGAVLSSYQHVSGRILNNADTILANKVKNLETVVKEFEAQDEVVKKLLKDSLDGDKKAVQDL